MTSAGAADDLGAAGVRSAEEVSGGGVAREAAELAPDVAQGAMDLSESGDDEALDDAVTR